MKRYDVVVVGGGPAGSCCAYFLAKSGVNVLLLDKAAFPRQKMCGGGVPASVFEDLPISPEDVKALELKRYILSFRGERETYGNMPPKSVYSVSRDIFDASLVNMAREEGASFKDGIKVVKIEEERDGVLVLCEKGEKFWGKFLVGAWGGNLKLTRDMGFLRKKREGFCGYFEVFSEDAFSKYANGVHLDFNFVNRGWAGVLPKRDHLWVGVFSSHHFKPSFIREETCRFMDVLSLHGRMSSFKGVWIPLYTKGGISYSKGRVVLVGEAACLVNPLSGEGIKPAIDSSQVASKYVLDALHKGEMDHISYEKEIYNRIGKELYWAEVFSHVAFTFPSIAYDGMRRVVKDAVKILNGNLSYEHFLKRLKRKILKHVGWKG